MSYPIQSLAIIAPITLLVLLIIIPVIGVFAGWKRAAYWGGGTFFFFLVGSIVYRLAGGSIFNALKPLLTSLLEKTGAKVTITNELLQAICAPVFFLAVMMVAELLLLINYYAWFKRVAKIKRDVKLRKEMKAAKKAGAKLPKIEQPGWSQLQFTTKGKVINKVCGGAGLALLMVPSTITFTQAIYYLTTSPTTRAKNDFNAKLFNGLENFSSAFSWMGYYGKKTTGDAYNSLFSTLELTQTQAKVVDPKTGTEVDGYIVYTYDATTDTTTQKVVKDTILNGVVGIMQNGFEGVFKQATSTGEAKGGQTAIQNQTEHVVDSINAFAKGWNTLLDSASLQITSVFSSTEVTSLFKGIIGSLPSGAQDPIPGTNYDELFGDNSAFTNLLNSYENGKVDVGGTKGEMDIDQLKTIPVSQQSFNNLKESISGMINTTDLSSTQKTDFDSKLGSIVSMLFQVQ